MKHSPVTITEPAAVAALKEIYQTNGPGNLEWDFSVPGQVTALDGRLKARDGALTGLNLDRAELKGTLKLRWVETLSLLTAYGNNLGGIDLEDLPGLRELTLRKSQIKERVIPRKTLKEDPKLKKVPIIVDGFKVEVSEELARLLVNKPGIRATCLIPTESTRKILNNPQFSKPMAPGEHEKWIEKIIKKLRNESKS